MPELRSLAYFVTACRCDALARAARELGIALSTLSGALKTLEAELGIQLFHRVHHGLYPTAEARWLMRAAEPLLDCEAFARRWMGAARTRPARLLAVELGLGFTVGGISAAIESAIDSFGTERPEVFVDPVWVDEKDWPRISGLGADLSIASVSRILIRLAPERARQRAGAMRLFNDRWVFALRLPASTSRAAAVADVAAGRLIVPALAPALIEQADRYFRRNKITSVHFLNDHPGELPRLIDEHPDAAFFVPESLVSPRLGLSRVRTVAADPPLTMAISAHVSAPDAVTAAFLRRLRRALTSPVRTHPRRPAVTLRQAHYFNLVHRLRRMSAAAHAANVSQPALSEQIQKLEHALSAELFDRRGDGVIPNERAERFAGVAKAIEAGFRRIAEGQSAAGSAPSRRISIGILPSVNQHGHLVNRITEAVLGLQTRHPGLKLVVQEAPNGVLQDWVMRSLVGVAIVETGLPHMPRLPLGSSEQLAAVAHARHALLPPGPVGLADLVRLPLALPTARFGLRQLLEAAADKRDLRIQPSLEVDALSMIAAVLERARVLTVLPPSAVGRELAQGELIAHPIIEPTIERRLFAIYSGERTLSEAERDLVNSLRERLSESTDTDLMLSA